ncbi:MAG TPA: HDOD domain-containing protein [Isosphaeraceae bacterium]|jgi:c-di-GMP-related signal transduction protein|nr:HDOD domain-containing protein [Isosphaeraceae bacterium]
MQVFIARQPIFDQRQRVAAYELLFRSSAENLFPRTDADHASESVISESLLVFGFGELTGWKRAFIHFTRGLLVRQAAMLLPPDKVVIEILESVEPDPPVLRACEALKKGGYWLALGNFALEPRYERLAELADIIKVDFLAARDHQRRAFVERFQPRRIKLLAEKVETLDDFTEALGLGYDFFEGYFFCTPEIISRTDIPVRKQAYLRLLRDLNDPEVNFDRLEMLIKQDVALSVKLLRYINSAWFGLSRKVLSIRHALVLLGTEVVRQWATLATVTGLGYDRPDELITTSLLRATFCERLAVPLRIPRRAAELFLVGLLSPLDALMGRPMDELLTEIAVPDDVRAALLGEPCHLREIYRLVLAYERGDWDGVIALATSLRLDEDLLPGIYQQSVQWVNQVLST